MLKNPKPFNNILPISAGFFLLCREGVCECIVCKMNRIPVFLKRNQASFDIYLRKEWNQ